MGTSVNWYMVDPEAFKRYVKIGNKFDKLEEKLYKAIVATLTLNA